MGNGGGGLGCLYELGSFVAPCTLSTNVSGLSLRATSPFKQVCFDAMYVRREQPTNTVVFNQVPNNIETGYQILFVINNIDTNTRFFRTSNQKFVGGHTRGVVPPKLGQF